MAQKPKKSQVERDIDDNLRRVYQELLDQDVPDRFTELLKQLRDEDREKDADT